MSTSIRPAVASDAQALAAIRAEPEPDPSVDKATTRLQLSTESYTALIQKHAGLVFVAESSGSVVGFVVLQRATHHAVVGDNPLKLWQIYVAPAHHGSGVASKLMSRTMEHARRHLNDVIWLGVSEHNARGVAFYRKHGFKALGLHQVATGGDAHQDIVMSCVVQ